MEDATRAGPSHHRGGERVETGEMARMASPRLETGVGGFRVAVEAAPHAIRGGGARTMSQWEGRGSPAPGGASLDEFWFLKWIPYRVHGAESEWDVYCDMQVFLLWMKSKFRGRMRTYAATRTTPLAKKNKRARHPTQQPPGVRPVRWRARSTRARPLDAPNRARTFTGADALQE